MRGLALKPYILLREIDQPGLVPGTVPAARPVLLLLLLALQNECKSCIRVCHGLRPLSSDWQFPSERNQ